MKVWRIVPKKTFVVPCTEKKSIQIKEIRVNPSTEEYWVYTSSDKATVTTTEIQARVAEVLAIHGKLEIHHTQSEGNSIDDNPVEGMEDGLQSIATFDDTSNIGEYDIPHEEYYDLVHKENEDIYDEAYWNACKVVKQSSQQVKADEQHTSDVLLGKAITAEPTAINEVLGEEDNKVVLKGKVVKVDFREFKSKRILLTFQMADKTNGVSGKRFFEISNQTNGKFKRRNSLTQGMYDSLKAQFVVGAHVLVSGSMQYDEYEKDYLLNVEDIMLVADDAVEREDTHPTPRVELHLHTVMSDMDALITVKDLIKTVKKWRHPAVAVTDHGVVQSFPLLQEISQDKSNQVKVIYGMEGYLFDEHIDQSYHIIILAKNQIGIRNLYKIVSISHLKYIYRGRPRIPRKVLNEYREGLILGTACEAGELIRSMVQKKLPYAELKKIASWYDYLEIQPISNNEFLLREGYVKDEEALRQINRTILRLGDDLGKLTVATGDAHFLNPEDKIYREILMTGKGFKDAQYQPDLYFRTTDEMLEEFAYLGEDRAKEVVITNTNKINDMIEAVRPIPKETLYFPKIPGSSDALKNMCYTKAHQVYGNPLPEIVTARLEEEFTSILGNGFGVLYYIAHKLVKHSHDDGYLVGSRGSVGSSFVATMADITEVNPLPPHYVCPYCQYSEFFTHGEVGGGFDLPDKVCPHCGTVLHKDGHNIPFAIFLGFDGDKVPDIDLNFSGEYHPKAHKYTEELFGKDNVFRAGTIGAVKDKTAYGYVMKWAEAKNITVNEAYINSLVSGCTGVKNTTGQHPGGVMVIPRDMDVHHFTPVQYPANKKDCGIITTHFDYHSIEGRLVKLDILGHDDPTVIRLLEDWTGVNARDIPFDDPKTMSLFSSPDALGLTAEELGSPVGSLGIPEFGTSFVRKMLVDTRPKTFSELVRISGFSHGTDVWLNNAQDLITSGTVPLKEAVSTRDDIMNYLIQHGIAPKTSFKVMENVRKGKGIDKVNKVGEKTTNYENELKEGNIPSWFIDSCKKIGYLFPRAHAVAYVMMAFRIAWFKINYPLAYYAAYFSIRAKAFKLSAMIHGLETQKHVMKAIAAKGNAASKIEQDLYSALELAVEMSLRGFSFLNVDIQRSHAKHFIICEGKILPPLTAVEGLGENVAEQIVEARNHGLFTSKADLRVRGKVGPTLIELMAEEGCLGGLPDDEQMDLFAM